MMSRNVRIKDLPLRERPRERLMQIGAESLDNTDLLGILLRTGLRGSSAIHLSEQLMRQFGSLQRLAKASLEELRKVPGVGPDKSVSLKAAFTLAQRMAREIQMESPLLDTPDRIADVLREDARMRDVEHFQVVLLNTRRKLISIVNITQGTLDSVLIHPREVFRAAVEHQASALVLTHNHPSGDPNPSEADIRVTRDLMRAGKILKIEVLDNIIMGQASEGRSRDFISLRELGYFYQ